MSRTQRVGRVSKRICRDLFGWKHMLLLSMVAFFPAGRAMSEQFTIPLPGGYSVRVEVAHVDPGGEFVEPSAPGVLPFKPPTIFSAPLPSGSGARALGQGGAFTAIADDATAASWNPGGLTQLERGEASFVLRYGREYNQHASSDDLFGVGRDSFDSQGLNYLSVVYPFQLAGRNFVVSANYQEAYDFAQAFSAEIRELRQSFVRENEDVTYRTVDVQRFDDGIVDVDVVTRLTTWRMTTLEQVLNSQSLTGLDFEQEGILDALTCSLAAELTPKLSVGVSANLYGDGFLDNENIRARTRARYSGESRSEVDVAERWTTAGTYTYDGTVHLPPGGGIPVAIDVPVSGEGDVAPFSDAATREEDAALRFEGLYEETSEFDEVHGVNATLGALWVVSRYLSLGAAVDLPWTAEGDQTRTARNTVTSYDEAGSVVNVQNSVEAATKAIEFEFPLYWAVGAVWRWTPSLYTSLDISQTLWSKFSFRAEGEPEINPLDGSRHGEHPIDDCWAVRAGAEYLCILSWTELPLRAGFFWEQRPAIGDPDEYWGASCGTGLSLGKGDTRLILDIAYHYTRGDDVMGSLVPDQPGMSTDIERHQAFVSGIWHF